MSLFFFTKDLLIGVCVSMWVYVYHLLPEVCGSQKKVLAPLKLELEVIVINVRGSES